MGLAYASKVTLSLGSDSNFGTLLAFVITTFFSLAMFGQSLGQKDRELAKCRLVAADHDLPRQGISDDHLDMASNAYKAIKRTNKQYLSTERQNLASTEA